MAEEPETQPDRRERVHQAAMQIALLMTEQRLTPDEGRDVLARSAIAWAGIGTEDLQKVKVNLTEFVARIEELFTQVSAVGVKRLQQTIKEELKARTLEGDGKGSFEGALCGWTPVHEDRASLIVRLDDGKEILIDDRCLVLPPEGWLGVSRIGKRVRVNYKTVGEGFRVRVTEIL